MKLEHKIGIAVTCTFLCLTGAVIGLKMQEQTPAESPKVAAADPEGPVAPIPDAKDLSSFDDKETSLPNVPKDPPVQSALPAADTARPPKKEDEPAVLAGKGKLPPQNEKHPPEKKGTSSGAALPPPEPVGPQPTLPPVIGAEEWGKTKSSSGPRESKPTAPSSAPAKETKTAPPPAPSLSPSPEVKKGPPATEPTPGKILPTSALEAATIKLPDPPPNPGAVPPAPAEAPSAPSGKGPSPTPGAVSNPAMGPALSGPGIPPYFAQQPASASPKSDPKPKEGASLPPLLAPEKAPPASPAPSTPSPPSTPAAAPAGASPAPLPPTAPPSAPPASAPLSMLKPTPLVEPAPAPSPVPAPAAAPAPVPTPAPVPVPAATPPSPPKPPEEGSSFVPDNPAAAPGPVGVKPAPLPLPTPPSSPLPTTPTPAVQRPASSGASVTVYDEQDYSCRGGDTWEEISKRFYMTDRYARALQRHNQNHARASEQMARTGQLTPGERVFVPQAYILEERYADAIPRPTPASASPTTPAAFVAPSGSPPPPPPPNP